MSKFQISPDSMWDEINAEFGESGGVYRLRCFEDSIDSGTIPIDRLLGRDEEGVLYIGKADSFVNRVADLKKSIAPKYTSTSHECGTRYKSSPAISGKFPFSNLYVELIGCNNQREKESELLKLYENKFGELPPLNRCG